MAELEPAWRHCGTRLVEGVELDENCPPLLDSSSCKYYHLEDAPIALVYLGINSTNIYKSGQDDIANLQVLSGGRTPQAPARLPFLSEPWLAVGQSLYA